MSDTQGPEQYRTKLSTASTILGLALFAALCISLCIRQYFVATSHRSWPWSSGRRDAPRSVEGRFSEDEPRTIAIGGRAKNLRIPRIWDAYIRPEGLVKHDKTNGKTVKTPERIFENGLASLQPVSIQMLTPHTAGPLCPNPVLPSPAPVTPPQTTQNNPQHPPRAVRVTLYPNGMLQSQRPTAPRDSTTATPHSHTGVPISVSTASTLEGLNPQEPPAPIPSGLSPNLPSTLAPHPLQLTFLIILPDPSFPSHFPPPPSHYPSRSVASSLSPTLGILTPPPHFLLPSLTIPAESLSSWWDTSDELSRAEGNRASRWEFHLRDMQEARDRVNGGDDAVFALRWNGRAVGRRG